ncbi:MAG: hypothetical protein OTI36_01830 [Beijerinckiaceae bacterium]|nr:hypothetical protein [Beijerinckiaceae bacterium]
MPKLTSAEVSSKITALLSELAAGEVHAVIVVAACIGTQKTSFGIETNTNKSVAKLLLSAGLKRSEDLQ